MRMNNTFRVGTLAFVLSLTAILPLFADETDKENGIDGLDEKIRQ